MIRVPDESELRDKRKAYILVEMMMALAVLGMFITAYVHAYVQLGRIEKTLRDQRSELFKIKNLYIYAMSVPIETLTNDDRFLIDYNPDTGEYRVSIEDYPDFSGYPLLRYY